MRVQNLAPFSLWEKGVQNKKAYILRSLLRIFSITINIKEIKKQINAIKNSNLVKKVTAIAIPPNAKAEIVIARIRNKIAHSNNIYIAPLCVIEPRADSAIMM